MCTSNKRIKAWVGVETAQPNVVACKQAQARRRRTCACSARPLGLLPDFSEGSRHPGVANALWACHGQPQTGSAREFRFR